MLIVEYDHRLPSGREIIMRSVPLDEAAIEVLALDLRRNGYRVRLIDEKLPIREAPQKFVCSESRKFVDDPCKACGVPRSEHKVTKVKTRSRKK